MNIPTVHDFFVDCTEKYNISPMDTVEDIADILHKCFIEFAKLHVNKALMVASEKANIVEQYGAGSKENISTIDFEIKDVFSISRSGHGDSSYSIFRVNKESILNAYPESNIT